MTRNLVVLHKFCMACVSSSSCVSISLFFLLFFTGLENANLLIVFFMCKKMKWKWCMMRFVQYECVCEWTYANTDRCTHACNTHLWQWMCMHTCTLIAEALLQWKIRLYESWVTRKNLDMCDRYFRFGSRVGAVTIFGFWNWFRSGPVRSYLAPNEINFRGRTWSRPPHGRKIEIAVTRIQILHVTQLSYKRMFHLYNASAINMQSSWKSTHPNELAHNKHR